MPLKRSKELNSQARELGRVGGRKNRYLPPIKELPNALNTAAATELILHAIGDLLSNKMDPRHATALVQLVNCSQRINQHAELEARLEKLEQVSNGTGAPLSDKDSHPTTQANGPRGQVEEGKGRTPSNSLAYAKKAAS